MTINPADNPPPYLCAAARAAWQAGMAKAKEQGSWDDLSQMALEALASGAAAYLKAAAAPHHAGINEELRRRIRAAMVDWDLLAADDVDVARVPPNGVDADIAQLCGVSLH